MGEFLYNLVLSLNPFKYTLLTLRSYSKGMAYLFKLVLLFTFLLFLLFIPKLSELPYEIETNLAKIQILNSSGRVNLSSPIIFPESSPIVIADINVTEPYADVPLFFANRSFFYNGLNSSYSAFLNLSNLDENLYSLLRIGVFLVIPSLFFYLFLLFFVKYFVISFILAAFFVLTLDLTTSWAISWNKSINLTFFASTWAIPIEIILSPYNVKWLLPVYSVWKFTFYAVPLIIYLLFVIFALIIILNHQQKKTKVDIE